MTVLTSPATLLLQNHVLTGLPASVQQRLIPCLEIFTMPTGMVLHKSGDTMHHVYFPTDSIVTLLYDTNDALSPEILVAGNESVIGLEQLTGGRPPVQALVQREGYALYLPVQMLRDVIGPGTELLRLLQRHALNQHRRMFRSAACACHQHSVLQRFSRWLLQSLKYQSGSELTITRHLIASLLGVRRQCVSDAAGKLERLGVIQYSGTHINVLEPRQLERLCFACHVADPVRADVPPLTADYPQRTRLRLMS